MRSKDNRDKIYEQRSDSGISECRTESSKVTVGRASGISEHRTIKQKLL